MSNKFFTISSILAFCGILLGLASFNYFFDCYGFFQKNNGVAFAAKSVSQGETIAGLENFDERLFQKQVFQNFEAYPDTVIVGSSRSMMIQSSMLGNSGKVFNHSVSGASLEDYIGILGMYTEKNKLPKRIILGIDPWIFNKNNGQDRWKSLLPEYNFMSKEISTEPLQISEHNDKNKYLQLINFENTKNNILHLRDNHRIKIITDENIDAAIKRADGSIAYPFKIRFQEDGETQKQAKSYLSGHIYSVEKFKELSNTKLFETFVTYLVSHGTKVEFFLPPYHPIVYSHFVHNHQYENIMSAEAYLRSFSKTNNILLYGSYNPDIFGFTSNDFTDGMHGKAIVSKKILSNKSF